MKKKLTDKEIGVLEKVKDARGGFRTRASLGSADRETADRLVRKKLLAVLPRLKSPRRPKRFELTDAGTVAALDAGLGASGPTRLKAAKGAS